MDTCLVFCKALKVPYARSTTFLYFSLLSQDVQRACQRTDQFRPCFEQWAQIQFLCSSIYHFVCYVSAWSLTKVAIVLEGHFLCFFFPFASQGFSTAYWKVSIWQVRFTLFPQQSWLRCSNEAVCKLLASYCCEKEMKRRKQVDCMLL